MVEAVIDPTQLVKTNITLLESDSLIKHSVDVLSDIKASEVFFDKGYNRICERLRDNQKALNPLLIGKILYCLGYKSQVFLYLGILIECLLNDVACLYASNEWTTYNNLDYSKKFISKTLTEKADCLETYNFFNDATANQVVARCIGLVTPFRNYAGHSKNSQFLELFYCEEDNIEKEVNNCLDLANKILTAKENLLKNPPPKNTPVVVVP